MSRFDKYIRLMDEDYKKDRSNQHCVVSVYECPENDICLLEHVTCEPCPGCNNYGITYKDMLKLLEIPDE